MIARFQWLPADAPQFGWLAPCSPTGVVSPSPDPAVMAAVFGPEGPVGPPGGTLFLVNATEILSGHRAVRAVPGGCAYASADESDHAEAFLGVTVTAALAGDEISVVGPGGVIEESTWNWMPGAVFLGVDGVLVQPAPNDGLFSLQVGVALDDQTLLVTPRPPIFL